MGSGSSKAKNITVQNARISSAQEPVANVNKPESTSQITTVKDQITSRDKVKNTVNDTDNVHENKKDTKKKKDISRKTVDSGLKSENPSELVFQDDSDLEEDIDQVLKIPMALDNSRHKEKRRKQDRNKDKSGYDKVQQSNVNVAKGSTDAETGETPLPETYVQRLQRQQYKFQHNLLLHDREIVRNSEEWRHENDDDMHHDSHQMGFDATKFRAANKGEDHKRDMRTTESGDIKTPGYFQSVQGDFDDFEWNTKEDVSLNQQLPHYDQSELDLMKQLEEEIL